MIARSERSAKRRARRACAHLPTFDAPPPCWGVRTACRGPAYRRVRAPSTLQAPARTQMSSSQIPPRGAHRIPAYHRPAGVIALAASRSRAGCSSSGCRCCSSWRGWWPGRCVTPSFSSSWRCSSRCCSTRSFAGSGRVWIPRGSPLRSCISTFAAAVALAVIALATVVVQQTRHASHRIDNYFTVDSGRPPADGRRARPRAPAGVARRSSPAARARREAGQQVPDVDRDEGRQEVHDEGAELGGGRGRRRRRPAVQHRCSSSSCRSTCCSTCIDLRRPSTGDSHRDPGRTPLIERMEQRARELREGAARCCR